MDEDKKQQGASGSENIGDRLNKELQKDTASPEISPSELEDTTILPSPTEPSSVVANEPPEDSRFKRFIHTKKGKIILILGTFLVVVIALMAIPITRYGSLGTFLKKDVPVVVTDTVTKKPVTEAMVYLGNLSAKTDHEGKVTLQDVPVGEYKLKVAKNYYAEFEVPLTVPIFGNRGEPKVDLVATGRQVSVILTDTITKKPLEKAMLTVGETSSISDGEGLVTIVLPVDQETLPGQVKLEGYNETTVQVKVTDAADANKFAITPAGSIYFLSKHTGKINVMKSNLDGVNAGVIVEGNGLESDTNTALLAARDWQYMALSARRKAISVGQLHMIDTKSGALKTIDEGNIDIQLVGWSDHNFLYIVTRNEKKIWEDKRQALKSYNADTGALTTLDETYGVGTTISNAEYEVFNSPYIIEGKLLYAKPLYREQVAKLVRTDKKSTIMVITPSSGKKEVLKDFPPSEASSLLARLYAPQEVYFRVAGDSNTASYYEYEGGSLKTVTNSDEKFFNTFYPTYLISPDGQKTFWHESRNGKNAIFIGDKNGKNSKELAIDSEYATYGWFTDKYILLSKNASELYIAPADQSLGEPVKIANYHKPAALSFAGYGYGYGGL